MNGQRKETTDGRCRQRGSKRPLPIVFALLAVLIVTPALAANVRVATGLYNIESYTVMPHLEEMRRITKTGQHCVAEGDVTGLFPVMRQTAFRGCVLLPRASDEGEYELRCQTELVATGLAVLDHDASTITGALAVKMGGKNMTFSQHTTAHFIGPCGGAKPEASTD